MATTARFAYVFQDVQLDLFTRLARNLKIKEASREGYFADKFVLLKRVDGRNVQFSVHDRATNLSSKEEINQEMDTLRLLIKSVVSGQRQLEFKMPVPELVDETRLGLVALLVDYMEEVWSMVSERQFWERMLGSGSYMMIVFCTILFIWLMMMFSAERSDPLEATRSKR